MDTSIFNQLNQETIIRIALILAGAWLLAFLAQRFLPWLANSFSGRLRLFTLGLVPVLRLLIIVIAAVLIIPLLVKPTFENLVALLGALGLALGFAFKDYISSLIAGIVTLYETPYRPGDWIQVNGTYGEVKEINMRTVDIVTPDDTIVVIPHLKIWDQLIFNANDGSQNLLCVTNFYLHPQHDAALVKNILYDLILTSPYTQLNQPVNVVISDNPWGTHYRLKAYPIDPRQQFAFITDLTVRGKVALIDLGVEFAVVPAMNATQP